MTAPLARAILDALCSDSAACDELRALLQIQPPQSAPAPGRWMGSAAAADYLGISRNALHKHTSARTIPFEQSGPNGKLWFRAAELDEWRRGQRPGALESATPTRYVRAGASH
jgi:Helix-turn-helix domain